MSRLKYKPIKRVEKAKNKTNLYEALKFINSFKVTSSLIAMTSSFKLYWFVKLAKILF